MAEIFLRGALEKDADMLFAWRNDPETRRNSISQDEIQFSDHVRWLGNQLRSSDSRLEIALLDGVPIGTVRFDWDESREGADISFTVAPEYRGRGYGFQIVAHALRNVRNARITGEVKISNAASRKIFEKLGFRIIDSQGEMLMYAKDFA